MVQTPTKPLTLDAFLQQPETKPASEYIDGQIVQKPMPKADHSIIQTDLATAINAVVKPNRQGRALTELRCTFAGRSIVPDITVLPWSMIPRTEEGRAAGEILAAPEWMIEILSPKQSQTRVVKKILHALENGTQLSWLVDRDCIEFCVSDLESNHSRRRSQHGPNKERTESRR
ncbi:MAG: Uma2 family endonuclease [Cyanobacteria bacterium P01_D01_bin.1]